MAERKYERSLRIRTVGMREWGREVGHYSRYEATPYRALDELFKNYRPARTDQVVDFGCGRGRVTFYIHHRFHIPVTGIEVNEKTYQEAVDNKERYRQVAKHIAAPIKLDFGLAEHYQIRAAENLFYFFNPFSAKIFKQVVNNILTSYREQERPLDIILYYPMPGYVRFLKNRTPFRLLNKVRVPGANEARKMFKIYRLS